MSTINTQVVLHPDAKPEREDRPIAICDSHKYFRGIAFCVNTGKTLKSAIMKCRRMNRDYGGARYTVNGIAYC